MRWLLLLLPCVFATNRVVLTFESWELASKSHEMNATVVKQYGRRLVLDLGREYVQSTDDTWIRNQVNESIVIEEDFRIRMEQVLDFHDMSMELDEPEFPYNLANMEWVESSTEIAFQTTPPPVYAAETSSSQAVLPQVPWNLADSEPYSIKVEGLWKKTNSTPDVVVAVIDSGIAEPAKSAFLNLLNGYDFISDTEISGDGDARDPDSTDPGPTSPECPQPGWHGTKVASVLAAKHSSGVYGVAQNCSVLPIRVLGLCSEGYANDITDAIVWAIGGTINGIQKNQRPAKILSLSLAGTGACPSYLQSAINQANAAGATIVAAAGNGGLPTIANTFPANCVHVISVGAISRSGELTSFSNRGATNNAPGHQISVLMNAQTVSGTSFAVPHVSGLSALYLPLGSGFNMSKNNSKVQGQFANTYWDWHCASTGWFSDAYTSGCRGCPGGTYKEGNTWVHHWWVFVNVPGWGRGTYDNRYFNNYPVYNVGGKYLACAAASNQGTANTWNLFTCVDCGSWTWWAIGGTCDNHLDTLPALGGKYGCYPCAQGQYSGGWGDPCHNCPPGTYGPEDVMSSCPNCPAGKYSNGEGWHACWNCPAGQSSAERSRDCSGCPAGTYNPSEGGLCTGCPACGTNYYRTGCSGSSAGGCTICTCSPNTYQSSGCSGMTGPTCTGCPTNTNGPGGTSPAITTCTANAGFYGAAGTAATQCTAGFYCPAASVNRLQCAANMYCPAQSSTQTGCPSNTNSPVQSTAITACVANAGFYGAVGTAATQCTAGFYCPAGSVNRIQCVANTYCPLQSSTQTNCPANTNSPVQSTVITACVANAGFYGAAGTAATQCTAGYYCPVGSVNRIACGTGYYCPTGASQQTACPANTNSVSQSTVLSACLANAGYFGVGVASLCNAGYYCTGTNTMLACSNGTFSAIGASVCTGCAPSLYMEAPGASACLGCAPSCTLTQHMQITCTPSTNRLCCDRYKCARSDVL